MSGSFNVDSLIEYIKSMPEFQKQLREKGSEFVRMGGAGSGAGVVGGTSYSLATIAQEFVNELRTQMSSHGLVGLDMYNVGDPVEIAPGRFEIRIEFPDQEGIHRPSLRPDKYPAGAYDIVTLLDEGYSADRPIYGMWHGQRIKSRQTFTGYHFIEDAIDDFTRKHQADFAIVSIHR